MSAPRGAAMTNPSTSLIELHDRLDALWISYLRHVDRYTAAQKAIHQHLRSGFFSLSRANFKARPGTRYGRDYYHERAVASRRAKIHHGDREDGRPSLEVIWRPVISPDDDDEDPVEREDASDDPQQQPSPPPTPGSGNDSTGVSATISNQSTKPIGEKDDSAAASKQMAKPPLEADPLRWYGILVPQELRSAQTSFASALDESVGNATNASRGMREVEVEIRRLRKEIRKVERAGKP